MALSLAATGCSSIQVKTDYDPSAEFAAYRTFAVRTGRMVGARPTTGPGVITPTQARIRQGIAAQLRAKGLVEVENGQPPDLVATYVAGARRRTELEGVMPAPYADWGVDPWAPVGWWGPGYSTWWTRTYEQGTLVIDLANPRTRQIVWRAYVQANLTGKDIGSQIDSSVEKAFQEFPPKPK